MAASIRRLYILARMATLRFRDRPARRILVKLNSVERRLVPVSSPLGLKPSSPNVGCDGVPLVVYGRLMVRLLEVHPRELEELRGSLFHPTSCQSSCSGLYLTKTRPEERKASLCIRIPNTTPVSTHGLTLTSSCHGLCVSGRPLSGGGWNDPQ